MKIKSDFLKSGAVYTILGFLPTASRFFLFPLFLHYLSPEDFALISLNTMVASILPAFITLGLEASMNRFYFDFVKYPKIEKAFISTLILSICCFAFVIAIFFLAIGPALFHFSFKTHRFSFYPFGITALLTAIPGGLYALYLNYLRCKKALRNYVLLNLGLFILTSLGEIIGVVFLKLHVEQLVWIKPLITWPIVLLSTILLLYHTGIHFDKRLLRIALSYSTPLLPHILFGMVFLYSDRIMIEHYAAELYFLSIYNLAMAISNVIDIFEQSLRNATFPDVYKMLKENVYTNVVPISRIHTVNGLILTAIMAVIILCTPFGVFHLLQKAYNPLVYLIPFALIISVVRFYYLMYVEPLFFFKKIKEVSTSTVIQGCFAILLNYLLIPKFGLMGALLANIISKAIQVGFIYYISAKIKIFQYKVGFILKCMTSLVIMMIAICYVSQNFADNRILIYLIDCIPVIFVGLTVLYFFRKDKQKDLHDRALHH